MTLNNLDVGKYFALCNFGGRIMRGFKVIEGKHCVYKLQIVFWAHSSIIFTRDLGMR